MQLNNNKKNILDNEQNNTNIALDNILSEGSQYRGQAEDAEKVKVTPPRDPNPLNCSKCCLI